MEADRLLKLLPSVRGQYKPDFALSSSTWLGVGGKAELLFVPSDTSDLCKFLQDKGGIEVNVLGLGSNILIRDAGVSGVVIKLGKGFNAFTVNDRVVTVGCGLSNHHLTKILGEKGLSGLEFLCAIPGSVGGAVAMNAGCYGKETADFLLSVEAVSLDDGQLYTFNKADIEFSYRTNPLSDRFIFTSAAFLLDVMPDRSIIKSNMDRILHMKASAQPLKERTGGSTFKNPAKSSYKAWELIDMAGLRGYCYGNACISDKHPNFLTNTGDATAKDLEDLGNSIVVFVERCFGIRLEWEIKRMGKR